MNDVQIINQSPSSSRVVRLTLLDIKRFDKFIFQNGYSVEKWFHYYEIAEHRLFEMWHHAWHERQPPSTVTFALTNVVIGQQRVYPVSEERGQPIVIAITFA